MFRTTLRAEPLLGLVLMAVTTNWCLPALQADEAVYSLRYNFQPNQALYYEVDNSMRIETRFNGGTEEQANHSQAWKQLRVASLDAQGNAQLEPIIERVVMKATKSGEDPVGYDSAHDSDPPFQFLEVKRSIGQVQARILAAPNGSLKSVTPLTNDSATLKAAAEKNDPRLNFLVVLPEKPVRIGDSWTDRFKVEVTVDKNLRQEVELQRSYTLSAVNGSVAQIKMKTAVITPVDDPQIKVQLIQRTPAGTIDFDLEKGLILSMHTKAEQTVVDAFGPATSITASSKLTEKLLPGRPDHQIVSKPE